jgi:hypothetical protein
MIHEVSMFDFVILEENLDQNPKIGTLGDAISFGDSILSNHLRVFLSDSFVFTDSLREIGGATWKKTLSDSLSFSEQIHWRTHLQTISDFLFVHDWLENVPFNRLTDNLVFSDTMNGAAGAGLLDSLVVTDSLSYLAITRHPMNDLLVWAEGLSMYFNNGAWKPMVPIVPEVP